MTSASIPELKKVRTASVGVFTIASPRRLNDVFMMTGTPVRLPNSLIRFQYKRIDVFFHGLRPRAAVHVRDRGNDARVFRALPDW